MTKRNVRSTMKAAALVLLLCLLALVQVCGAMAEEISFSYKVADPSTVDSWKDFFGPTAFTTEYAGKVWTDKSVFTSLDDVKNGAGQTLLPEDKFRPLYGQDSFLVVLSAMASNKSIKGYEHTPTDTVLVLDMSNSMDSDVQELCDATNIALTKLLELNNNNRVGVVIYSGNTNVDLNNGKAWNASGKSKTTILMELDRYSTTRTKNKNGVIEYLKTNGGSKPHTISVNSGVYQGSSTTGTQYNGSRKNSSGTWIQDGAYEAMKQLTKKDIDVQEGPQAGARRLPIIVLMTDGAPTILTQNYYGVSSNSNTNTYYNDYNMTLPDGSTTPIFGSLGENNGNLSGASSDVKTFLTQLTAAYVREQVKKHYGREPMFYTVGFNITVGSSEYRVMNPVTTQQSQTLNGYWNGYLNTTNDDNYKAGSATVKRHADVKGYNYVDEYFSASSGGLEAAFQSIVNEIILQSLYYPTESAGGLHDIGGYIEFLDDIGEFMEVKDILGVRLSNEFYSGAQFASKLNDMRDMQLNPNKFSAESRQELTNLANEFVWSVQSRLGIENIQQARDLIDDAWVRGELSYTSDTEYSNYISWYGVKNPTTKEIKYLPLTASGEQPAGATHYIKSYGMIGHVNNQSTFRSTDMMYITIRVETELATGHQQVIFKVPASLIPLYSYEVELENLGADGEITENTVVKEVKQPQNAYPIRLIYEIGIQDDITAFNFNEKLATYKSKHGNAAYPYKDRDGNYYLYTNKWDQDEFDNVLNNLELHPHEKVNMVAWYEPSKDNERFFYTHNTTIYSAEGTVYTGSKPSATEGKTYYRPLTIFKSADQGKNWSVEIKYEPIASGTLQYALAKSGTEQQWYIPAGQVHRNVAGYRMWKGASQNEVSKNNVTQTIAYADYPAVEYDNENLNAPYYVDAILGNNGRLTIPKTAGLTIKKIVLNDGPTDVLFTVLIKPDTPFEKLCDALYTSADGTETKETVQFNENGASVQLMHNEQVTIIGLDEGEYTVEEDQLSSHWEQDSVTVGPFGISDNKPNLIIEAGKTTEVVFRNKLKTEGDLVIHKEVEGPVPEGYNPVFHFMVELSKGTYNASYQSSMGQISISDQNKFYVDLRAGESIAVYGLPNGTTATLTELNSTEKPMPSGFTKKPNTGTWSGTVSTTEPLELKAVNTYAPSWGTPPDIKINLTKLIDGRSWKEGETFLFNLSQLTYGADGQIVPVKLNANPLEVTSSAPVEDVFENLLENHVKTLGPGTYTFHIHEEIPEAANRAGGMTYETEVASILITVKDDQGTLKITELFASQLASATGDNTSGWTISAVFTNEYRIVNEGWFGIAVVKEIYDADTDQPVNPILGQSKKDFTFVMKNSDGFEVARAVSDENGHAKLMVTDIEKAGTYVYTLTEEASGRPNMTDDSVVWTITVTAVDNLNGTIETTIDSIVQDNSAVHPSTIDSKGTVPFRNVYCQSVAPVRIPILKTVNNLTGEKMGPEGFAFELIDAAGNQVATAQSGATGAAEIALEFKEENIGVHTFTLREVAGNVPNMVYSTVEHEIKIQVRRPAVNEQIGANALIAEIISEIPSGNEYPFENVYGSLEEMNIPATGDNSKLMFFAGMLLAAGFVFLCRRNWTQN